MTMELYQSVTPCSSEEHSNGSLIRSAILDGLPPTPSKFHYIFNLRDLSRIFNGLVTTIPERFQTAAQLTRVWRNECLRVLYDRLIDTQDRKFIDVRTSEQASAAPFTPARIHA